MKNRGIAVFSGIDTRLVDRLVRQLGANGIDSAFVEIRERLVDDKYFSRLLKQTLIVLERLRKHGAEPVLAVLVSGLVGAEILNVERRYFFPAMRRLAIDPAWRNNPDAAARIQAAVLAHFRSEEVNQFSRIVSPRREARLLLPLVNTNCKALDDQSVLIYTMTAKLLSGRVEREIVPLRKRKAYRVNGIDFEPIVNGDRHPIRRCSETAKCDLDAEFRFGSPVPQRMEFDVTCETGLRRKTFYQCDGTSETLTAEPTHLNMRINGDFKAC